MPSGAAVLNRQFVRSRARASGHIVGIVSQSPLPAAPSLTLRHMIDTHLAPAGPRVLTAHDRLDAPVSWVHSSEIFEIGPLLTGGELLLTTGLGLAGLDAGTRRHYVRDLAERGVAGLAFEVGRSFDAVPEEMIREGSAAHLPIIELTRIVPFIEVCRTANTEIVSEEVGDLRLRSGLDATLHDDLARGAAAAMIEHIAEVTGTPIVVVGSGGALLAVHGVNDDRAAWRVVDGAIAAQPITLRGREIGQVFAGQSASSIPAARVQALLGVGAGPLAAVLTRSGGRSSIGAQLVAELVDRRPLRRADLLARLSTSGLPVGDKAVLVPVAGHAPDTRMVETALSAATDLGGLVHATVDATVYGLVVTTDAGLTEPAEQVRAALANDPRRLGRLTVVVGTPCPLADTGAGPGLALTLADELRICSERLGVAVELRSAGGTATDIRTSRELVSDAAARELSDGLRSELSRIIDPLVRQDATSSSQLVHTLEVHLTHGCSATRSAEALHIGRQSLYQRLDRIRALLGFDPTAPAMYASILLAINVFHSRDADQR